MRSYNLWCAVLKLCLIVKGQGLARRIKSGHNVGIDFADAGEKKGENGASRLSKTIQTRSQILLNSKSIILLSGFCNSLSRLGTQAAGGKCIQYFLFSRVRLSSRTRTWQHDLQAAGCGFSTPRQGRQKRTHTTERAVGWSGIQPRGSSFSFAYHLAASTSPLRLRTDGKSSCWNRHKRRKARRGTFVHVFAGESKDSFVRCAHDLGFQHISVDIKEDLCPSETYGFLLSQCVGTYLQAPMLQGQYVRETDRVDVVWMGCVVYALPVVRGDNARS